MLHTYCAYHTHNPTRQRVEQSTSLSDESTGDKPRPNGGEPFVVEELKAPSLASPQGYGQVLLVGCFIISPKVLGVDVDETILACKFAGRGTGV